MVCLCSNIIYILYTNTIALIYVLYNYTNAKPSVVFHACDMHVTIATASFAAVPVSVIIRISPVTAII